MKTQKNWLEWSVFVIGLVLVLGTVGFLGWDAATSKGAPPDLVATLGTPRRVASSRGDQYVVPVKIVNRGEQTAEGVQIEVTLKSPGAETETAGFDVPFLPRQSSREGEVVFPTDPSSKKLEARVLGYEKP